MDTFVVIAVFVAVIVVGGYKALSAPPTPPNEHLVCPHCGVRGQVVAIAVRRKKGISGGKATGAVLTGGVSMLATGLSRKEAATQMTCGNCGTVWDV